MNEPMANLASESQQSLADLRRASRWIVLFFWLLQFVELSLLSLIEGRDAAVKSLEPRAMVMVVGVILMFGFVEIVAKLERRPFRTRLILTSLWALLFCLLVLAVNFGIFYLAFTRGKVGFNAGEYVYTAFAWSWFCLSVAGALLALSYNLEMRNRDHRLAAMEAIANRAQLAALRYQLNPHFLFNTLNSIASLIATGARDTAERMVEDLADFLRATLELDPHQDISLAREIELQQMYLAIEQLRFPDRLIIVIDVPDDLLDAHIPALITQPLVENCIRHAVARSVEPVTVRLTANALDGMLLLIVADDGRPLRAAAEGTGVGIANVEARLRARFGDSQAIIARRPAEGGFAVHINLPLARPS